MSELEMKLHCLQLAGGDVDRAQRMYEWLTEQAPAQPVHPEAELRTVPGAEEESRDHLIDAQTCEAVDPHCSWKAEGPAVNPVIAENEAYLAERIPERFTRHDGSKVCPVDEHARVSIVFRVPGAEHMIETTVATAGMLDWSTILGYEPWTPSPAYAENLARISAESDAYRIISTPADVELQAFLATPGAVLFDDETQTLPDGDYAGYWVADKLKAYIPLSTPAEPEQDASVEIETEAEIQYLNKPTTDLWQQGYDDKANGFEPSLAELDYLKGYEARKAIEDEQAATYEQAKFFAEGMMADADRHAREQSIMEKAGEALAAIFKREREDA